MTYEKFLELKKHYRIIAEWDEGLKNCNKDSAFIYCYGGKMKLYPEGEKTFRIDVFASINLSEKFKANDIPYIEWYGEAGEFIMIFDEVYLDDVLKIVKPKTAPQVPVNPFSVRNHNLWLRVMRNIHIRYADKLEESISEKRKDNNREGDE